MNKDTLILEQITDKNTKLVKSKIELYANDDGKVYLSLPTATYELMYNEVIKFSDMNFLYYFVDKNSKSKVLFPLTDSQVGKVEDFFDYWSQDRLVEMKMEKWNRFCGFWITVFDFVRDNINLEDNKVTYESRSHYYNDGDGGVFNNFDIYLGEEYFGSKEELGEQYYDHYIDLTNELQSEIIDKYFQDDLGTIWVSEFHISFRP